jgi:dihydrofolate synthase / folylpolyglutamate synthase
MTYEEAAARLQALRGGELRGMRPGLERITTLLEALGNPERAFEIVQVAGTNGKGSAAAMLASILQAAGRRVGLYTSPHLVSFRERIRLDGAPIPEADVVDGVEALGTLVARLDATMFEAVTALALDHFARSGVDVAVLEVGLGGRLDATTVGKPSVEVIARIDYDHEAQLGSTLEAIAAEKAAVIRSGVAIAARQAPEVEAVLSRRAADMGVPLLLEGRDLGVSLRRFALEGQRIDLWGPGWRLDDVFCPLLGLFQPANALLAVAGARCLGVENRHIRDGLAAVHWPGRFQVLSRDPVVVLDGAHNPGGARALADSLRAYFPRTPVTFVLGVSADKDAAGILAALWPLAARMILTAAPNARAAAPAALRALLPADDPRVQVAASPAAALELATAPARTPVVCVAGSLFVIGDILARRAATPEILFGHEPRPC